LKEARAVNGIRAILVENDALLLSTLIDSLRAHGIAVVAQSSNAKDVAALQREHGPNVALLDLDLGFGPTGLDLAVLLRKNDPLIGLVMLTRFSDPRLKSPELPAIPRGLIYLPKGDVADAREVVRAVGQAFRAPLATRKHQPNLQVPEAQLEVMRLAAQGLSTAEIARQRGVSTKAIEKMLGKIYRDFGISSDPAMNPRAALVRAYLVLAGDIES